MHLRQYTVGNGTTITLGVNAAAERLYGDRLDGRYSVESLQLASDPSQDAMLHVITPAQMGAAAIASATASAFKDPTKTAVAFLEDDGQEFDDNQRAEIAGVQAVIALSKAKCFSDAQSLEDYIASLERCKK